MAAMTFDHIQVPATASAIQDFYTEKLGRFVWRCKNLGSNNAVLKLQESADGSVFTDISGATATITPQGVKIVSVISHKPYIRIHGSGNTLVKTEFDFEGIPFFGNIAVMNRKPGKTAFTTD